MSMLEPLARLSLTYLINTRSTFKRNAANCANKCSVSLESPRTKEFGIGAKGAPHDACEPDRELGRDFEMDVGRFDVEEPCRADGSSRTASSLVND